MSVAQDVARSSAAADRAISLYRGFLVEFVRACERADWSAAEAARSCAEDAHGAYLDHYAAMFKRTEGEL